MITDTSKLVKSVHPQNLEEAKLQIRWRGYVKFNTYYEYNGLKSTEGFLTCEIPLDPYLNKNYTGLYAGARQSRLGMETSINSKIGLIRTYIEGDFAGSKYPLAFEYFWRRNWSFSAIAGMVYLWYPRDQPDDSFRSSYYGSVNAFWEPIDIGRVGLEWSLGKQTDHERKSGTASRLQFAANFFF